MSKVCYVCRHKDRLEIDKELIEGKVPMISLSRKYGLSESSLNYHKSQNHISKRLAKSFFLKEQQEDFDILNRINNIVRDAEIIFKRNFDKNRDRIALKALDSQRATFDLLAKILYVHEKAKQTELEILQQNKNTAFREQQTDNAIEFVDALDILNPEERTIWEKLFSKINSQDESIIIFPKDNVYNPVLKPKHKIEDIKDVQDIKDVKEQPIDEDIPFKVGTVEPEKIHFTEKLVR